MALVIKGLIIWKSKCHKKFPVVCDGYVKYEEAEVDRSAIMQDFRNNEKKTTIKNGRLATILSQKTAILKLSGYVKYMGKHKLID